MRRAAAAVLVTLGAAALAIVVLPGQSSAGGPLGQPTGLVSVGPGAAESSIRQIVRTPAGRVYIAAVDDDRLGEEGRFARLRMYVADQTGIPASFHEADAGNAPAVSGGPSPRRPNLGGGDARLDAAGTIHVAYFRTDTGAAAYRTFSTATDTWSSSQETVATIAGAAGSSYIGTRGFVVDALTLDKQGRPVIVVVSPSTPSGVRVFRRGPLGWTGVTLESHPGSRAIWHPSLTTDRSGALHLAWAEQDGGFETIRYARAAPDGKWGPVEVVAAGDVLGDSNGGVVDQSPSVAVDRQDRPVVLYVTGKPGSLVRLAVRACAGGWAPDDPPRAFSHTPGLYLRGDDRFALLGHDANIHPAYLTRGGGSAGWSNQALLSPPGNPASYRYDGSASARFDPLRETDPRLVDTVFFDEDSDARGGFRPDLYYAAIDLRSAPRAGAEACPPAGCRCQRTRPALARARLTRRAFRAGDRRAAFTYRLSEAAAVSIAVDARRPGRRVGRSCRRRGRGNRCTLFERRGTIRTSARRGSNRTAFAGLIRRRRLPAGDYRAMLVAVGRAGGRSAAVTLTFRILR